MGPKWLRMSFATLGRPHKTMILKNYAQCKEHSRTLGEEN